MGGNIRICDNQKGVVIHHKPMFRAHTRWLVDSSKFMPLKSQSFDVVGRDCWGCKRIWSGAYKILSKQLIQLLCFTSPLGKTV